MTFREAFSAVQGLVANYAPENSYLVAAAHLKHATTEFCKSPALAQAQAIACNGSRDYTLPQSRIGRVYRVEHQINNTIYPVELKDLNEFSDIFYDSTETGTNVESAAIFGRTLRVAPLASTGTITLMCSLVPIATLRDTLRDRIETATGGTVATAACSTITHGIVANRAGTTDYFNGCRIYFETGSSASQSSFVTSANEGASAITFSFLPSVSAAIVNTDTLRVEDVLEVPDQWARYCVLYAAGMMASMDKEARILTERLLGAYDDGLKEARGKPFGWQPASHHRIRDYMERIGNRWAS